MGCIVGCRGLVQLGVVQGWQGGLEQLCNGVEEMNRVTLSRVYLFVNVIVNVSVRYRCELDLIIIIEFIGKFILYKHTPCYFIACLKDVFWPVWYCGSKAIMGNISCTFLPIFGKSSWAVFEPGSVEDWAWLNISTSVFYRSATMVGILGSNVM